MGAPGTMPISMRRRAIAHDPCTLTTRAATPEASVSSDPDSASIRLDFFSFFLNLSRLCQGKIENSFQFHLGLKSNRRATLFFNHLPDLRRITRTVKFLLRRATLRKVSQLIEHFEDGFAVRCVSWNSSFVAPACGILRISPGIFRNKSRLIVRERGFCVGTNVAHSATYMRRKCPKEAARGMNEHPVSAGCSVSGQLLDAR
jgi:hypothetical protein